MDETSDPTDVDFDATADKSTFIADELGDIKDVDDFFGKQMHAICLGHFDKKSFPNILPLRESPHSFVLDQLYEHVTSDDNDDDTDEDVLKIFGSADPFSLMSGMLKKANALFLDCIDEEHEEHLVGKQTFSKITKWFEIIQKLENSELFSRMNQTCQEEISKQTARFLFITDGDPKVYCESQVETNQNNEFKFFTPTGLLVSIVTVIHQHTQKSPAISSWESHIGSFLPEALGYENFLSEPDRIKLPFIGAMPGSIWGEDQYEFNKNKAEPSTLDILSALLVTFQKVVHKYAYMDASSRSRPSETSRVVFLTGYVQYHQGETLKKMNDKAKNRKKQRKYHHKKSATYKPKLRGVFVPNMYLFGDQISHLFPHSPNQKINRSSKANRRSKGGTEPLPDTAY